MEEDPDKIVEENSEDSNKGEETEQDIDQDFSHAEPLGQGGTCLNSQTPKTSNCTINSNRGRSGPGAQSSRVDLKKQVVTCRFYARGHSNRGGECRFDKKAFLTCYINFSDFRN